MQAPCLCGPGGAEPSTHSPPVRGRLTPEVQTPDDIRNSGFQARPVMTPAPRVLGSLSRETVNSKQHPGRIPVGPDEGAHVKSFINTVHGITAVSGSSITNICEHHQRPNIGQKISHLTIKIRQT